MSYHEVVLDCLRNEPDPQCRTASHIAVKIGIPNHRIFKVLKSLVRQGYLTREAMKLGCGNHHAEYVYTVKE